MTHINLVEPFQMLSKPLMAEYRRLPRIFTAVRELEAQGKTAGDVEIPEHYVLGAGHERFFYPKIDWLRRRYAEIRDELISRDYILDPTLSAKILSDTESIGEGWRKPYKPTPDEICLSMAHLCVRSGLDSVADELARGLAPAKGLGAARSVRVEWERGLVALAGEDQ